MSGQEWKPGDVALVEAGCWANRKVALRLAEGWSHVNGVSLDSDGIATPIRPLVVIDPEDREQVERLAVAYATVESARLGDEYRAWENRSREAHCRIIDSLSVALREFANPTPPKPDEPQRIGAVVEDGKGSRWVRISDGWDDPEGPNVEQVSPPWRRRGHAARHYAKVDAVRVLSEGVTA